MSEAAGTREKGRWRRRLRRAALIAALALPVVVVGSGIAFWFGVGGTDPVVRAALARLSARPGSHWVIRVARVKGNPLARVTVDSLRVAWRHDAGREVELVRADRLHLAWRPRAMLHRRLDVRGVRLEGGEIWFSRLGDLEKGGATGASGASGATAGAQGGAARSAPITWLFGRLALERCRFVFREGDEPLSLDAVEGEIRDDGTGVGWQLALRHGLLRSSAGALPVRTCRIEAHIASRIVMVTGARLEAGNSALNAEGSIALDGEHARHAAVEVTGLDLGDLAPFVPNMRTSGRVTGSLLLTGGASGTDIAGTLQGTVAGTPFSARTLALHVAGGEVRLDSLAGELRGHPVRVSGGFTAAPRPGYHGRVEFQEFALDPWLRAGGEPVHGYLTGTLDVQGTGLRAGERELEAGLELEAGRVAGVVLPVSSVRGRENLDGSLTATVEARREKDELKGEVAQSADGALSGDIDIHLASASHHGFLGTLLGIEDVGGEGTLHGTLGGTRLRPEGRLAGKVRDLLVGGVRADSASLGAAWDPTVPGAPLSLDFDAGGIHGAGTSLDRAGFRLAGGLEHAAIRSLDLAGREFSATSEGMIERRGPATEITLTRIDVATGELGWQLASPAHLVSRPGTLELQPTSFTSGSAELALSGSLHEEALAGEVHLYGLELKSLGRISFLGGPAAGMVTAEANFAGTLSAPRGEATLTLANGVVRGVPVVHASLGALLEGGRITLHDGRVETAGGDLRLSGWLPVSRADSTAGEIRVSCEDLRLSSLRPVLPILSRAEGRVDLQAVCTRPFATPSVAMSGTVRHFALGDHEVGDLVASATLAGGVLEVPHAGITGGVNRGDVQLSGRFPVAALGDAPPAGGAQPAPGAPAAMGAPEYHLTADVKDGDLALITLITPYVSDANGAFSGHVDMVGNPGKRVYTGNVTVTRGRLVLPALSDTVREVSGAATVDSNRVTLTRLEGVEGAEGRAVVTGRVLLGLDRLDDFNLQVKTRRYEPHLWRDVSGLLNCDFTMTPDTLAGGRVVPHLAGEINAEEMLVRRELPPPPPAGAPNASAFGGPLPPIASTCDLRLWAHQNLRLETRDARLELGGEVFCSFDEQGLRLLGSLETIRGYYWIYNHRFEVQRGVFTFSDVSDLGNVGLDVLADTDVSGEKITVTMSGTLRQPTVETTSASNWDETTIFRTLTLGGGTPAASGSQSGTAPAGQGSFTNGLVNAWRGAILERWGARVAQDLGVDELRVLTESGNGQGPRLEVGKRWADLYLNVQTAIGQTGTSQTQTQTVTTVPDPSRVISLEYRMSELFSVDGEAGTREGTDYVNVDLKFKKDY